jgi:hypothetical protein
MKQFAFFTAAFLLLAACAKEEPAPTPQAEPTPSVSLTGTTWVGTYDDTFQGYPATLTWTLEILTDSTGALHFSLVIAAQPQPSLDNVFTYTFDGTNGTMYSDNMPEPGHFVYDSTRRIITMTLQIGDGNVTLGGETVFHPQGEAHDAFPVNTSWEAEQQLSSGDTLMPVEWGLDFWEYGWGGQVNYCANGTCAGTSFLWQYDNTAHAGHIRINNSTYQFNYDPASEILTLDYSTTVYGTSDTIGGTLMFHRKTEEQPGGGLDEGIGEVVVGMM